MSFYNLSYFLFLGIIWLAAGRVRKSSLRVSAFLLASYFFYWLLSPFFLGLLFSASLFNHCWIKVLRRRSTPAFLWFGILVNVTILVGSRYALTLLSWIGVVAADPGVLMPIGVSFYTFQGIGSLVDVYRGYPDDPAWPEFFLFMAFWPIILAGPICRLPEMLPQFRRTTTATREQLWEGSRRIVLGLFLKVVLADTLASGLRSGQGITAGFDSLQSGWSSLDVWCLALGYGFQIFFDFAGYSHIAIGSANLFGIRPRENFQDPYCSVTLADFWNRWHMSLSSWIRDYLFFPLAILRPGVTWRTLTVIFSLCVFGLWHGFTTHYLLWGLYHGALLALYRVIQDFRKRHPAMRRIPAAAESAAGWALTFFPVSLSWILFRSTSLDQVRELVTSLLSPGRSNLLSPQLYGIVLVTGGGYFLWQGFRRYFPAWRPAENTGLVSRVVTGVALTVAILMVVIWSDQRSPFVYVQF